MCAKNTYTHKNGTLHSREVDWDEALKSLKECLGQDSPTHLQNEFVARTIPLAQTLAKAKAARYKGQRNATKIDEDVCLSAALEALRQIATSKTINMDDLSAGDLKGLCAGSPHLNPKEKRLFFQANQNSAVFCRSISETTRQKPRNPCDLDAGTLGLCVTTVDRRLIDAERMAIGRGRIARPLILSLDEEVEGADSSSAKRVPEVAGRSERSADHAEAVEYILGKLETWASAEVLSPKEYRVMKAVVAMGPKGYSYRDIAKELSMNEQAVTYAVSAFRKRLGEPKNADLRATIEDVLLADTAKTRDDAGPGKWDR